MGEKSHFSCRFLLYSGNFWCANFPLGAAFYGVVGKHPRLLHWASPKSEAVQLGSVKRGYPLLLPASGRWWCCKKWENLTHLHHQCGGSNSFWTAQSWSCLKQGLTPSQPRSSMSQVQSTKICGLIFLPLAFYAWIFRVAFLPVGQYLCPLRACSRLPDTVVGRFALVSCKELEGG